MIKPLRICVYTGKGASHSWIWLVNTLDKYKFRNIQFTSSCKNVAETDVLVISGGDPFAIFSHIGKEGVSSIRKFIKTGGTYIGICAGTYFALQFHENPYPWLNLVKGEISNFGVIPPPNIRMPHKYTVPYRNGVVFHPVRDAVLLQYQGSPLTAPLYGGPGIVSADAEFFAKYTKFTEKTIFLCDEPIAENTLLGTYALLHTSIGAGQLFLFGPHFEHPYYPEANTALTNMLSSIPASNYQFVPSGTLISGIEKRKWVKDLKRWISNGRLAAFGLENYHWKIGEKIYDPERLAYFFETCFQLVKFFESQQFIYSIDTLPSKACYLAKKVRTLGSDPVKAEIILEGIKEVTTLLYSLYFSTLQQLQPVHTL
jgi:hypothetical protein